MTATGRLFTDDELAALARSPRAQLEVALADRDADAARTVRSLDRGYEASVTGLQTWSATVLDFLARRGGVEALIGAVAAIAPQLEEERTGPSSAPSVDEVAEAATGGDAEATLALFDQLVERIRFQHDVLLDLVCLLMSHVYRSEGVDALHESIRNTGDHMLLSWMPQDVSQPPETRIRNWTKMVKGNFATIRLEEDEEKFAVTQDPCGTCGRQILDRGYPGPLDLAVVEEEDLLTYGQGGVPVYRTHVPVLHVEIPGERRGVPWPVVRCPAGLRAGPCQILIFKDPDDPKASSYVGFADEAATETTERGTGK